MSVLITLTFLGSPFGRVDNWGSEDGFVVNCSLCLPLVSAFSDSAHNFLANSRKSSGVAWMNISSALVSFSIVIMVTVSFVFESQ